MVAAPAALAALVDRNARRVTEFADLLTRNPPMLLFRAYNFEPVYHRVQVGRGAEQRVSSMQPGVRRVSLAICIIVGLFAWTSAARADHPCDPVSDPNWKVVPSHEVVDQKTGPPYQDPASGDWFVERTTTVLPYCSYFNAIGIYSMRSYSLSPETAKERVQICRVEGGRSVAVAPYEGLCPPR
jgi:hypothetical protein